MEILKERYNQFGTYVTELFRQGLSPGQLSLSITLGILIGILPLFGVATITVSALALWMRVNLPIAVFVSYVVTPIHLVLVIPFIRIGEWLTAAKPSEISLDAILQSFEASFLNTIGFFIEQFGFGVLGWIAVAIPAAVLFHLALRQVLIWRLPFTR